MDVLVQDRRMVLVPAGLAILYFLFGLSLYISVLSIVSVLIGGYTGKLLVYWSEGNLFWNVYSYLSSKEEKKKRWINEQRSSSSPWTGLTISSSVNRALEELMEQLIDNYVNTWYKTEISDDQQLLHEIRYQIRFASSVLFARLRQVDLSQLILSEAIPAFVLHLERIERFNVVTGNQVDQGEFMYVYIQRLHSESRVLDECPDTHWALGSRLAEVSYLRQLADYLVAQIVDETRLAGRAPDDDSPLLCSTGRAWPSHSGRHLLRELIVFCFLMPLLDLIASPDTINRILILLFDPTPSCPYAQSEETKVEILNGLTEGTMNADSLIQVKLSDVLRDPRLLNAFGLYLKDIHGPTNQLAFLVQAGDIHTRLQTLHSINVDEVHFDAWELYRKYVHETAIDPIRLEEEVVEEFRMAVEAKDSDLLDRVIEKSESFLGRICGSPPVSVDELLMTDSARSTSSLETFETNFSFAQFRKRLWRVIMPQSTDGTMDRDSFEYGYDANMTDELPMISVRNDDFSLGICQIDDDLNGDDLSDVDEQDNCDLPSEQSVEEGEEDGSMIVSRPRFSQRVDLVQRDLSRWIIGIPHIEPRRDPVTGRTMYVYMVSVERRDLPVENDEGLLNMWTVPRRYHEFYLLESKLLQFHGDAICTSTLPPKKSISVKNQRAFIESQRPLMEHFLRSLTQQSALRKSEQLSSFLSTSDEIRDENNLMLADLNPWRVVKRVPGKFQRERGQHLKPALLNDIASLINNGTDNAETIQLTVQLDNRSDAMSSSSISMEPSSRPRQLLFNSIFGNNYPAGAFDPITTVTTVTGVVENGWTRSVTDALLFFSLKVSSIPRQMAVMLIAVRSLMRETIDRIVADKLRGFLHGIFNDSPTMVSLIVLIQEALFTYEEDHSTDQEKSLRAELAERRVVEWIEETMPMSGLGGRRWRMETVRVLLSALQYPILNKQLSMLLLDRLVKALFPFNDTDGTRHDLSTSSLRM